jgi:hypothetical protein
VLPSPSSLAHLGTVLPPAPQLIFGSGERGPPSLPCLGVTWEGEFNKSTEQEGPGLFWHLGKGLVQDGVSFRKQKFPDGERPLWFIKGSEESGAFSFVTSPCQKNS